MNVQDEIKALKKRIAELEERAKEVDGFPQDGDEYWYIDETGDLLCENWEDYSTEKDMLAIGNVFKTKQEAEFVVEKLKVEAELRKFSKPFEEGNDNWIVTWNVSDSDFKTCSFVRTIYLGAIYFESEEKARQAIQSVGEERIKKYIFGVEVTE